MKAKFEIELEFDPAKRAEIIATAKELFIERTSDVSVVDEEGHWEDCAAKDISPQDLQDSLAELLIITINDHLDYLGIEVVGSSGPGILEGEQPIN